MKSYKMQGQSDYFSGIWIVKGAALWYAVHRADRSAEGAAVQHRKGEGYGTYQSSKGRLRHGEQGQVLRQLRHSPNVKKGERIMRINWFKDENHLVYINGATQLAELERTLHFPGLEEAANELRQHPTAEGFTIKGPKRTSGRLFVPDLTFGEHIEMGENIFFYMGEMQECYVIYWLDAPVAK